MDFSELPKSVRKNLFALYVFEVFLLVLLFPGGAGEEYGKIIYFCLPLLVVSCLLKHLLMMHSWTSCIIFAILSTFYLFLIPIEFGLRSFLIPEDNSNNMFGQLLIETGVLPSNYYQTDNGWRQYCARFVLNAMILMDLVFFVLHLCVLVTHDFEAEEPPMYPIPDRVQPVRLPQRAPDYIRTTGPSTRSSRRHDEVLPAADSEFNQQFLERMRCDICADRSKEKRCRSCKHGLCAVCVAQIEESQNPPLCPMCRRHLITEDLVLCRL